MTDYELLQESIKIAGKYIVPIIEKYELQTDTNTAGALAEAFQAGVQYAVDEMKGM